MCVSVLQPFITFKENHFHREQLYTYNINSDEGVVVVPVVVIVAFYCNSEFKRLRHILHVLWARIYVQIYVCVRCSFRGFLSFSPPNLRFSLSTPARRRVFLRPGKRDKVLTAFRFYDTRRARDGYRDEGGPCRKILLLPPPSPVPAVYARLLRCVRGARVFKYH